MRFWPFLLVMMGCAQSEVAVTPLAPEAAAPDEVRGVASQEPSEDLDLAAPAPLQWRPMTNRAASFQGQIADDNSTVEESFWVGEGATTAMADYLFVVDDSVSMGNILDSFQRGFAALADSDAFPANAKIAVMNMTPADPDNLRRRHPVVPFRMQAVPSPGFVRLVDEAGIARFNEAALHMERLDPLELEGCNPWFSPEATNANGSSCLMAHTQLGLRRSVAEAGLVSFAQLLQKSRGKPIFREGAAVNVILVSDTHGPGFRPGPPDSFTEEQFEALLGIQPRYAQLKAMVESTQLVASFRVHAIAPESECSEPWMAWLDPVYFEVAEDGEGVVADSCTTTDYSAVIRSIAERGAEIQRSVYPLSVPQNRRHVEVESVLRGTTPVGWTMSPSGRALVLDEDEMASEKEAITIRYRLARPARTVGPGAQSLESARQAR